MTPSKSGIDLGIWSRSETWEARNVPLLTTGALLSLLGVLLVFQTKRTYNFADYVAEQLKLMGQVTSAFVLNFPILAETAKGRDGDPVFQEKIQRLEGEPVAIIGFMAPYDQLDDMTYCMILPSYVGCSFCEPPSLDQVVFVRQKDPDSGIKKPFIEEPVLVTGELKLYREDSHHPGHLSQFLYVMDDARIAAYDGPFRPTKAVTKHITNPNAAPPTRLGKRSPPSNHPNTPKS